jgi:hypothetical protein
MGAAVTFESTAPTTAETNKRNGEGGIFTIHASSLRFRVSEKPGHGNLYAEGRTG